MRTTLTNIILFATLAMLLLGCNKLPGASGAVKYPPSWPIKELTIPPGAKQIALPAGHNAGATEPSSELYIDGAETTGAGQADHRAWEVCFSFGGGIKAAADHLEKSLKQLGYLRWQRSEDRIRWISADLTRQVQLHYIDETQSSQVAGQAPFKGYRLHLVYWAHPRPDVQGTEPIP